MKKLFLLLLLVLIYDVLFSQTIKDRQILCVNGIPLNCLNTGDTLKGESVTYEVKKSDCYLL